MDDAQLDQFVLNKKLLTFGSAVFLLGGLSQINPRFYWAEIETLVYEKITSDDRMVKVWRPHYQISKEVINIEKKQ